MMKNKLAIIFACAALLFAFNLAAFGQQRNSNSNIVKTQLSQAEIDRIIRTFTTKEQEYRQALNNYSFQRKAKVQVFGDGGQVAGEYVRESAYIFDDKGNRFERVLFAPVPTFAGVTAEDLDDLGGVNPFALEPSKISLYNFTFIGKEKIDDLNLYVFDVEPKIKPDPNKSRDRFFGGRIWIDDTDLQIVKTKGKGLPETKDNKFPIVETWRENIDGKFWFPTYSYANDQLYFEKSGQTMKIKLLVRYTDFKEGKATVRILGDDEIVEEPTTKKPDDKQNPSDKKP
jgi:hypothetical protein